jgi:hypothetical protein
MKLSDDNFIVYAMRNYDNPQCQTVTEFEEDLKRFLYLKKLFSRYSKDGDLKERLILNHIIVIYNLFGEASTKMLFFKIEKEHWSALITFLVYLNKVDEKIEDFGLVSDIKIDQRVANVLRNI